MSTTFEHFDAGLAVLQKQIQTALGEAVGEWNEERMDGLNESRRVLRHLRECLKSSLCDPVPIERDMVGEKRQAEMPGMRMMGGRYA